MALGQMRGAALAAAPAVLTRERERECPRELVVLTRPSRHGQELAGRKADRRPAPARLVQGERSRRSDSLAICRRADAAGNSRQVCPERRKEGLLMRAQWT
jgi:hypothetical protein